MQIKELREKTKSELEDLEKELRGKLFHLRLQLNAGKVKNFHVYSETKRDVARVKTILQEKV